MVVIFSGILDRVFSGGSSSDTTDEGFSGSTRGRCSCTTVETVSGVLRETVSAWTGGSLSDSNGGTLFIMTHPSDSYM